MTATTFGIVGNGTVGRALARSYMEWGEVRVHDSSPEKSTHSLHQVLDSHFVFICLPTNSDGQGSLEVHLLDRLFSSMRGAKSNLILKSTVPVGYTNKIALSYSLPNLVHSPEFLTARCSLVDAQLPSRNIIGIPIGDDNLSEKCQCALDLEALYLRRFPGCPLFKMSSDESEIVKLACNSFFAVKIAFFNEIRTLVDLRDMEWQNVMAGIMSDGRISHSHTRVPGQDSRFGWGGSCLSKDSECLASLMDEAQLIAPVIKGAIERNKVDRNRRV